MFSYNELIRVRLILFSVLFWALLIFCRLLQLQVWEPNVRRSQSEQISKSTTFKQPGNTSSSPSQPPPPSVKQLDPKKTASNDIGQGTTSDNRFLRWIRSEPAVAAPLLTLFGVIVGTSLTVLILPVVRYTILYLWDSSLLFLTRRKSEISYLNWVVAQHQFLPILPTTLVPVTTGRAHHELDDLYIALETQSEGSKNSTESTGIFSGCNRIVLLGDPGSGKTTTLRFFALTLARARLKRPGKMPLHERMTTRASFLRSRQWVSKALPKRDVPIPVFLSLSRLRDLDKWTNEMNITDFVQKQCNRVDGLSSLPSDFFRKKVQSGRCVFLFDGLDEVGTADSRDRVLSLLSDLATSISPDNIIIVSSRTTGYRGQLSGHGFRTFTIKPLSWSLVEILVNKWYSALGNSELASDLLNAMKSRPPLRELAINPMLLSLVVLVQYVRRLIPDRRNLLYDECLKILIERRFAPPAVQEEYNLT